MTYEKNLEWLSQCYPKRCELNNRVLIGKCTYGAPEIKTWGENSILQIGKFCSISDKVTIFLGGEHRSDWVSTYPFNAFLEKYSFIKGHPKTKGDVIIGNDVWIASGATILSGVTIGDGAIIGCNSLICKDVPPYAVVAGNPQKIIRYRFEEDIIKELVQIKWWDWRLTEIEKAIPLLLNKNIQGFISYAKTKNMDIINIKAEIVELKSDLFDIIAEFQAGHDNKATLKVAAVTQKIMNILSSINSIGINEILNIDYNRLNTILLNTSKSLEIENYILINDLFEYELIPVLDIWISKLETSISREA